MSSLEVSQSGTNGHPFLPEFGDIEILENVVTTDGTTATGVKISSSPGRSTEYAVSLIPADTLFEDGKINIRRQSHENGTVTDQDEMEISINPHGQSLSDRGILEGVILAALARRSEMNKSDQAEEIAA